MKTLLESYNFEDEVFEAFRLMNLPYLALEQVIKSMSLMEAFNLSICSPTLQHFVKYFFKNQQIKLQVHIYDGIQFRLESPNGSFISIKARDCLEDLDGCMRMKIGNASKIPFYYCDPDQNHLVTCWRDIVKGAIELNSLILDLFNIHFEKLHVWKEKINYDYGPVVDWINRINRPIEDVYFAKGTVEDTLYSQNINSENFRKCRIHQNPSENFQSPEFRFTNADVNWQVFNSDWMTLENLSDIGSACLKLYDVKFTDQEMNIFLRTLITGKFPNLEMIELRLNRRDLNLALIMDGIVDRENVEMNWDVRVFDRFGYNTSVRGTIDVQMDTGETCSIKLYASAVYVFIWK
ncbi:unnamed protein product [Caenorhabditis brenneri]